MHHRDDGKEDTTAITAAQQSQAAVLAADSAVEKDGAVTERKHFPMNLNMTGYVVFSVSCQYYSHVDSCTHLQLNVRQVVDSMYMAL